MTSIYMWGIKAFKWVGRGAKLLECFITIGMIYFKKIYQIMMSYTKLFGVQLLGQLIKGWGKTLDPKFFFIL